MEPVESKITKEEYRELLAIKYPNDLFEIFPCSCNLEFCLGWKHTTDHPGSASHPTAVKPASTGTA